MEGWSSLNTFIRFNSLDVHATPAHMSFGRHPKLMSFALRLRDIHWWDDGLQRVHSPMFFLFWVAVSPVHHLWSVIAICYIPPVCELNLFNVLNLCGNWMLKLLHHSHHSSAILKRSSAKQPLSSLFMISSSTCAKVIDGQWLRSPILDLSSF